MRVAVVEVKGPVVELTIVGASTGQGKAVGARYDVTVTAPGISPHHMGVGSSGAGRIVIDHPYGGPGHASISLALHTGAVKEVAAPKPPFWPKHMDVVNVTEPAEVLSYDIPAGA